MNQPSSHPGFGFWTPAIDLYENADSYFLFAELPGVGPDDVEVLVEDRAVVIEGQKRRPVTGLSADSVEIEAGHFRRIVPLPGDVDRENARAELRDGLLRIELPKPVDRKVQVPIVSPPEEQDGTIIDSGACGSPCQRSTDVEEDHEETHGS